MTVRATVRLIACASALALGSVAPLVVGIEAREGGTAARANVWSGVFTNAQAKRGEARYLQHCSSCHAADLSGTTPLAPPLIDRPFHQGWDGKSVGDLFGYVTVSMPKNAPGSLKPAEYADIVAYVLKANRFPSGARELPADGNALRRIAFTRRK